MESRWRTGSLRTISLGLFKAAVGFSFAHRIAKPFYSYIDASSVDPIAVLKMSLLRKNAD